MRVLIEIVVLALGLGVAYGLGRLSAWSFPPGANDIWMITWVAMAVVVVLGVRKIVRVSSERPGHRGGNAPRG